MPKERHVLCQKLFGMCFVLFCFSIHLAFRRILIIHTSEIMALPTVVYLRTEMEESISCFNDEINMQDF